MGCTGDNIFWPEKSKIGMSTKSQIESNLSLTIGKEEGGKGREERTVIID